MSAFEAPDSEAGVAGRVRAAYEAGSPLAICGAGTKAAMLRPVQAAATLSTSGLAGITLYAPKELVIAAKPGTPVDELEQAVAKQGQYLIAEPPDFSRLFGSERVQTLGGLVGANLSGPRRIAWGALRDHVLGIRAVDGTGEVFHSGGRVLKNVTGLDLCKLLTGSHGTLGVLTEITLKVLPAPPACGTVAVRAPTAGAGVAALSAGLGSPYGVSAAAWIPDGAAIAETARYGEGVALLRIEEFASSVAYRCGRLREELAGLGETDVILDEPARAIWRAVRDATCLPAGAEEAVWRVSVRPSRAPRVLAALAQRCRGFLDWGGGLIWLAGAADAATHDAVCAASGEAGGTWTLFRGPEALRRTVAVIPPEPPALARLGEGVKAVLDPKGILNPGRMRAGS